MDWCLALGVKTFPAGFSTTNKLLFVRRNGEEVMWGCIGREGTEWQLLTSEVFISHSNFLVHTDGLWYCCWSVYHVLDSLLGCKCLQAICGLMGSCIHPADIWLSVIIASLLPESLSDPLDPLWTHYSDVPRLQAADMRNRVSSWLWRPWERFIKWRGVPIRLEGWLFSSALCLMVQPFPLKRGEVTLWTRRERVHSKIIFTVLPRLLFPVVFAWKCSNQN